MKITKNLSLKTKKHLKILVCKLLGDIMKKKYYCSECGNEKSSQGHRCNDCYRYKGGGRFIGKKTNPKQKRLI